MDPDPVGPWNEEGGIRIGKFVPDMDDGLAVGASSGNDAGSVFQCLFDSESGSFPVGRYSF